MGTRRDARRALLRAAASGIALAACGARAQQGTAGWPSKPVRIVSPYPAGGSNDQVARVLAAKLGELWNQRVYVENRPGANNRIATQELARAAPDGYQLMLAAAPHGANPGLYDHKLPYDTLKDFVHIVRATVSPVGFFVPQAAPYRTLKELADAARAQPGKLFAGSPGNGSGPHMVIELWNWKTGARFEHLPMKGDAPLAVETVAARVDVGVTGLAVMRPHLESGRVRSPRPGFPRSTASRGSASSRPRACRASSPRGSPATRARCSRSPTCAGRSRRRAPSCRAARPSSSRRSSPRKSTSGARSRVPRA
jgi:tripartite-type tricarboxylate transporter receptor subunit TctC